MTVYSDLMNINFTPFLHISLIGYRFLLRMDFFLLFPDIILRCSPLKCHEIFSLQQNISSKRSSNWKRLLLCRCQWQCGDQNICPAIYYMVYFLYGTIIVIIEEYHYCHFQIHDYYLTRLLFLYFPLAQSVHLPQHTKQQKK